MAYMKDSSGRRLDSFEVQGAAKSLRVASWHRKVREGTADTNVLIVGDSTGAGLTRWVRLMATKIAAAYPTHTVIYKAWDDGTKTYPAGQFVTVQAGTGPRTITVWNGSLSGSVIGYARDNYSALTGGQTPDVLLVNFGHNSPQLADDYRAIHQEALQIFTNTHANAAVVLMTQNPRAITDPAYADDQGKQHAIYQLAVAAGHDLVDVNEAYRLYGNYAADLVLPDGLHPTDAGSALWADLVWKSLAPGRVAIPAGYQATHNRVFVPATQFLANQGAPTLAIHFGVPCWELDGATIESVSTVVDIPSAWDKQNIRVLWTSENGAAPNQVVWSGDHMYVGTASAFGGSIQLGAWSASGGGNSSASTTAGKTTQADIWQRTGLGQSPVALRIGRNASHANDTLAADALFIGLIIDRAY